MKQERWIVGAEHDGSLLKTLGQSLQALGYTFDEQSWGIGGSQEISSWPVHGPRGNLMVEAETYVGLSVMGDSLLIAELKHSFVGAQPASNNLKSRAAKPPTLG